MAEQIQSADPVDFGTEINTHPVDDLTLGTYTGRYEDKDNYFEG
ncbi:hypothetical protein [Streptomyces sp. S1]